jgi:ribosomal protein L34E
MTTEASKKPSRPYAGVTYICGWEDCDIKGQEQEGDHETVYFATLCVRCQRPVYGVVDGRS